MKFGIQVCICVVLITFHNTDAFYRKKRSVESQVQKIPVVGSTLKGSMDESEMLYKGAEAAINIIVARLLGGTYPCIVSTDGVKCQPVHSYSGLTNMINKSLNGKFVPSSFRKFLMKLIETGIDPVWDVIVGGTAVKERPKSAGPLNQSEPKIGEESSENPSSGSKPGATTTQKPKPTTTPAPSSE